MSCKPGTNIDLVNSITEFFKKNWNFMQQMNENYFEMHYGCSFNGWFTKSIPEDPAKN